MRTLTVLVALLSLFGFTACGTGGGSGTPPGSLSLALSSASPLVFPQQGTITVDVTLTRSGTTGNASLTVNGLPTGASATIQSPGSSNSGSIAFSTTTAAASNYDLTVTATDGTATASVPLTLTVGAVAKIGITKNGRFEVAMSTSFQPAEWDYQFFTLNPGATTTLDNLRSQHVRLQGVSQGVPQKTASTWDFSMLDAVTQPVLSVNDHSPEFQIAKAGSFMYVNGDSNNAFLDSTFQQFAGYTQNLVRYYNAGGFTSGDGTFHVSPAYPTDVVTWWGIYNEPNINNNLTPQQYVTMYDKVVPAMQTIDPTLKFAALELADFSQEAHTWVPPFVNPSTGVKAQVDVVATHFYSTCNQRDTDATLFSTIPGFVSDVQFFYQQMATNPALAQVPVWVTENNVNADYDKGGGISNCNGGQFVTDQRGSSPYFAAWRPYVFSQLGKAGTKALYHWDFGADKQYGEVDYATGAYQLSYWVDYWLARMLPSPPGADLLDYTATDSTDIEVLPVLNLDGSVTVMIADYAVRAAGDNNGPGAPRTVQIDTSAFGNFTAASLLTIDANTNVATGPTASAVTPAPQMTVTLNGYGVVFLTLVP
jgi:Glycosyl hydrolase catalytic core